MNTTTPTSRRQMLSRTGSATLSAAAVALLAGHSGLASAHASGSSAGDINILNTALALEHEAIAAYQLGAESGLLAQPVLELARAFQGHHQAHRDALQATLRRLGGRPVADRSKADHAQALQAASLKTQADVLSLALRLELGATNAYLSVIPSFKDGQLAQVAARLAADETMHCVALLGALGRPLPAGALSFGA
jgi:rubrerythrin